MLAVGGVDVVELRRSGEVVLGSESLVHEWEGTEWRFGSEANRAAFASDPTAHAPAFHGQCSFAMSLGKTVPGNPKHRSVVEGKLYLNSNPVAKLLWRLLPGRIEAGHRAWKAVR